MWRVVKHTASGNIHIAHMDDHTAARYLALSTHPSGQSSIETLGQAKSATPPEPIKRSRKSMQNRATSGRNLQRLKLSASSRKILDAFMNDLITTPAQAELIETMLGRPNPTTATRK